MCISGILYENMSLASEMISSLILLIKSVCIVLKPKNNKLYCPNVRLDWNILLEYISYTKCLGFPFNMNSQGLFKYITDKCVLC